MPLAVMGTLLIVCHAAPPTKPKRWELKYFDSERNPIVDIQVCGRSRYNSSVRVWHNITLRVLVFERPVEARPLPIGSTIIYGGSDSKLLLTVIQEFTGRYRSNHPRRARKEAWQIKHVISEWTSQEPETELSCMMKGIWRRDFNRKNHIVYM